MFRSTVMALAAMMLAGSAVAQTAPDPYQPRAEVTIHHPDWMKTAVLYQINTRQFTPEGTFRAAEKQLPRLKALGVTVLWLMPIHLIGQQHRKGTLGSPYSVRDYLSGAEQAIGFTDGPVAGRYRDCASGQAVALEAGSRVTLPPWSYRVLAMAR